MSNQTQPRSPGEYIRLLLAEKEWTQVDLGTILGMPPSRVNDLIQNKRSIDPELAIRLSDAFVGTTAEEWLTLESTYRLSLIEGRDDSVRKRVSLIEMAPSREMEKRGWISKTSSVEEMETELLRFFDVDSLNTPPTLQAATRKTDAIDELTPAQRAWCFRVRNLARKIVVAPFNKDRLADCERELRKLAAFPQEARKVSSIFADFGIRFVVVEPIASCKVDGVALWLDGSSPVIGVSLRFDRIDSFWFTVLHEFIHIRNEDALSVDTNLVGAEAFVTDIPAIERKANEGASNCLIPAATLESFVQRVGPIYSIERINQFARRVKIHPGIVVGQLQHRAEVGFYAHKETQVKIRDIVVATAVTDGWGHTID